MIENFIIIPAYNEEKNLIKLLRKILNLKIKKLKILIIDDSKLSYKKI